MAAEHGLLRHVRAALPHGCRRPPGTAADGEREREGRDGRMENRGDGWTDAGPSCSLTEQRRTATCLQAAAGDAGENIMGSHRHRVAVFWPRSVLSQAFETLSAEC